MKRVIVTGGSGFLGTNLIESLRSTGAEVFNVDIAPPPIVDQMSLWRRVDILDIAALRHLIVDVRPETVIHLAARTDLDGRGPADYVANTHGTRNVIEAANAVGSV